MLTTVRTAYLPQNEHPVNPAALEQLQAARQHPDPQVPYVHQLVDWALDEDRGGLSLSEEYGYLEYEAGPILRDPLRGPARSVSLWTISLPAGAARWTRRVGDSWRWA